MKVVLVNKFLYPSAGAETAFFATRALLEREGHQVFDFAMRGSRNVDSRESRYFARERNYDSADRRAAARDALASVYSFEARRSFSRLLDDVKPDVVHFHNIYHQLTLSLVDAARKRKIASVMTLHDYKIGCPSYVLYRDNKICHDCVGRFPSGVIRHSCVKGSAVPSGLAFVEAVLVRARRLYSSIDLLIAPSQFAATIANESGARPGSVVVLPNFVASSEIDPPAEAERPESFVFAGRLEDVKGLGTIIPLFRDRRVPGKLVVLGDGPLANDVRTAAQSSDGLVYKGRVTREEVGAEYRTARAALFPSLWEENCPMSLLEARAAGAAVVASRSGGLIDLVSDGVDGLLARPGDAAEWTTAIARIVLDSELSLSMSHAGRERLLRDHSADGHYAGLLDAYTGAISRQASRPERAGRTS